MLQIFLKGIKYSLGLIVEANWPRMNLDSLPFTQILIFMLYHYLSYSLYHEFPENSRNYQSTIIIIVYKNKVKMWVGGLRIEVKLHLLYIEN